MKEKCTSLEDVKDIIARCYAILLIDWKMANKHVSKIGFFYANVLSSELPSILFLDVQSLSVSEVGEGTKVLIRWKVSIQSGWVADPNVSCFQMKSSMVISHRCYWYCCECFRLSKINKDPFGILRRCRLHARIMMSIVVDQILLWTS